MTDSTVYEGPPEPSGISDAHEFVRRLVALWSWAGRPSEEELGSIVGPRHTASGFVAEGIPTGTVERVLSGVPLPWDEVELFITACLRSRDRDAAPDVTPWREAWQNTRPQEVPAPANLVMSQHPDTAPEPARPRWRLPVAAGIAVIAILAVTAGGIALTDSGRDSAGGDTPVGLPSRSASGSPGLSSTPTASAPSPTSASPVPDPPDLTDPPSKPTKTAGGPASPSGPVSAKPSPTGKPFLITESAVSLNAASGHGCKAWMNGQTPGPYVQGLVHSSGDDCEMALYRSKDGGQRFYIVSGTHRLSAGDDSTHLYWDGDVYLARVCLNDHTTGEGTCGNYYGPGLSGG